MSKFHINSKGVPAPCKAVKGNCPFGGADSHFDTVGQAQQAADKLGEEKYGLLQNVDNKLDDLANTLGVEKTLNGISLYLINNDLVRINEGLIHDYDLDDFIDDDTENERFAQIRRFLGDDALLNDLSTRLTSDELENSTLFINKLYSKEMNDENKEEVFSKLENLVNSSDEAFVLDKLEMDFSKNKLKEIKSEIIEDYDLDDFIDDDTDVQQFRQIRRFLGDESVLNDLTTRLTSSELSEHINNIEKYF